MSRIVLASSTEWLSSSHIPYAIDRAVAPSPSSDPWRGRRLAERIADLQRLAK